MSTADSTQKRPDMLMSDRTVLKKKSTDHSEARIEEEGRERIKKGRIHPPGELDKQLRNSRLRRGEYG